MIDIQFTQGERAVTTVTTDLARQCFLNGTREYPAIDWHWDEFHVAWQTATQRDPELKGRLADYLRLACIGQRPGAADAFERQYFVSMRDVVQRICGEDDRTATAMQRLREKLLLPPMTKLSSYVSTGSFGAWLKVVASRTALDTVRQDGARAKLHAELSERLRDMATGPETGAVRHELREVFQSALHAAVARLPERERQALRMHVVLDWSVTQIGRAFSVHRATAARWLLASKEQLNHLLLEELRVRTELDASEALALFGGVRSRLDLSLSQFFAPTGVNHEQGGVSREPGSVSRKLVDVPSAPATPVASNSRIHDTSVG